MAFPLAEDPRMGLNESLYHAQVVVKAFSDAIDASNCMSRISLIAIMEAEQYENRLKKTLRPLVVNPNGISLLDEEVNYTYSVPHVKDNRFVAEEEASENKVVPPEKTRDWMHECFDCDIDLPEFDFDAVFGSILVDIESFLDSIKALFDVHIPNMCQVAHMMSFICIPNLIAILASILSAIIKLLSSLSINDLSLNGFITSLLMKIVGSLLEYALSMVAAVMSPVACLLDSVATVVNKIPTKHNVQNQLSEEQYKTLTAGQEKGKSSNDLGEAVEEVSKAAQGYSNAATEALTEGFGLITDSLKLSNDAIQGTIDDLFGLIGYMDCEPNRSGNTIGEKISAALELVQVANLVMAIIDKKSISETIEDLCKEKEEALLGPESELKEEIKKEDATGFTNSELAEIIANALGVDNAEIAVDETGKGIALIIKEDTVKRPRLSLYGCEMSNVIKDYTAPAILERASVVTEEYLLEEFPYEKVNIGDYSLEDIKRIRRLGKPYFDFNNPPSGSDREEDKLTQAERLRDLDKEPVPGVVTSGKKEAPGEREETLLGGTNLVHLSTRSDGSTGPVKKGDDETSDTRYPGGTRPPGYTEQPGEVGTVGSVGGAGSVGGVGSVGSVGRVVPTEDDFRRIQKTGNRKPVSSRFTYVIVDTQTSDLEEDSGDTILYVNDGEGDGGISSIVKSHMKRTREDSKERDGTRPGPEGPRVSPPNITSTVIEDAKVSIQDIKRIVDITRDINPAKELFDPEDLTSRTIDQLIDTRKGKLTPSKKKADTIASSRDYSVPLDATYAKVAKDGNDKRERQRSSGPTYLENKIRTENRPGSASDAASATSEGILKGQAMSSGAYYGSISLRCNSLKDIESTLLGEK